MTFRIAVGLWLTVVVVLSLSLPMVARPEQWYDLPIVPGLEDKARIIFFHVPTGRPPLMTGVSPGAHPPAISVKTFPNPAHGNISFQFYLDGRADVVLDIYDVAGRLVGRVSENGTAAAWNTIGIGGDTEGIRFERSGVYFYRLSAGGRTATGKFTVVR